LVVLGQLFFTKLFKIEFTVVVLRESVGAAECGLALAFVSPNTDLLGALKALTSLLLNWFRLFFNDFNRLDFSHESCETLLINGSFMAYCWSISFGFRLGVIYNRNVNGFNLSLFFALTPEAARAKEIRLLATKELEAVIT
jgi:hypothetical protein